MVEGHIASRQNTLRYWARRMGGMGDVLVKLRLFLCSYAPLFLICGIRFETKWLSWLCYLLVIVSVVAGLSVVRATRKITPGDYVVMEVEDRGPEVAGYLASYLLPFVTVSQPTMSDLSGYVVFLCVAATLYVRSEMIQINPTLYLFGWKVLAITTSDNLSAYLLTKHDVLVKSTIRAARYQRNLLIEHPRGHGG